MVCMKMRKVDSISTVLEIEVIINILLTNEVFMIITNLFLVCFGLVIFDYSLCSYSISVFGLFLRKT